MKKLLLIFFCLPMIGFGQEKDVDISKVTINERNFIYKYQNFIEAVDEVVKYNEGLKKRAMLMYLLAVENINHYPDELKKIDLERATNEQLIELKSMFEDNYDSFIKIHTYQDSLIYQEALEMYRIKQ